MKLPPFENPAKRGPSAALGPLGSAFVPRCFDGGFERGREGGEDIVLSRFCWHVLKAFPIPCFPPSQAQPFPSPSPHPQHRAGAAAGGREDVEEGEGSPRSRVTRDRRDPSQCGSGIPQLLVRNTALTCSFSILYSTFSLWSQPLKGLGVGFFFFLVAVVFSLL